ncbi:hypothetical protein RN51_02636 [Microbacterium oxydans]|uniref:Aminoglycoside phosphotransferase domain-containing protein n=1 Tax=Microbacterium oxydans TaxID=82380 RepID=A0A0F0KJ01_9MICO|nr:hypothetical protein RN51_02636 [Microbacterium oxydans]
MDVNGIVRDRFGCDAVIERTFEGFYATVYLVSLEGGEQRILKCFHRSGIAEREAAALTRLAQSSPPALAVPSVLDVGQEGDRELIVQSFVPGQPVPEVLSFLGGSGQASDALAEQIIDVVEHWHSRVGESFEDRQGARHARFVDSFLADIGSLVGWLQEDETIGPDVRCRILDTVPLVPTLLHPLRDDPAVFIHDDCHAGNFLADPVSGHLTGVIDPGQARYTHRELDLFHLADAAPELRLWDRAVARRPIATGGEVRRRLFSIWDDVMHARASGWRDDAWFARKLDALDSSLCDAPMVTE